MQCHLQRPDLEAENADFPIRNWGDVQKRSKILEFTKESGVDQTHLVFSSVLICRDSSSLNIRQDEYLGIPEMQNEQTSFQMNLSP